MVVHLPKLQTGEHFDNLGMLTTLLSKKPTKPIKTEKPLIEVIGGKFAQIFSSTSQIQQKDTGLNFFVPWIWRQKPLTHDV